MHRRRQFEHPTWTEQVETMKVELAAMSAGQQRDDLIQKIRQLEMAAHMSDWLTIKKP